MTMTPLFFLLRPGPKRVSMRNTVKSKKDMDRIFTEGVRASCPLVMVITLPSPTGADATDGRVAFVAGKKLGTAPARNRAKRVLREAARKLGAPWAGQDVVFVARRDTAACGTEDLVAQCRKCLVKAGILDI